MSRAPLSARTLVAESLKIGERDPANGENAPIEMVIRSRSVLDLNYWGRFVHDLDSVQTKAVIPIDFRHDSATPIGYLDQFAVEDAGLVGRGFLVPFAADDRAAEAIFKAQRGIPYEASIMWDDSRAENEEIPAGKVVKVDGQEHAGPLKVVRNWDLLAVALCLHGADRETSVKLEEEDDMPAETKTILAKIAAGLASLAKMAPREDVELTEEPDPEDIDLEAAEIEAAPHVEETEAAVPDERSQAAILHGMFGEKGAVWFAEGRSLEECCGLYVADLVEEVRTLKLERAELEKRLESTAGDGEEQPVSADKIKAEADNPATYSMGAARARKAALIAQHRRQPAEK